MRSVEPALNELVRDRFYRSAEVKFEAGNPVLLGTPELIKYAEEGALENRGTIHGNGR